MKRALVGIAALGLLLAAGRVRAEEPADAPTVESLRQKIDQLSEDLKALQDGKPLPKPESESAKAEAPPEEEKPKYLDTSPFQPYRVEDAEPLKPGVELNVAVLNVDELGNNELRFAPTVMAGTPWGLEIGASGPFAIDDGDLKWAPAASAHALARVTKAEGWRPELSLRGDVVFPNEDEGAGAAMTALATEELGKYRVHGNARYEAKNHGTSSWFTGVAADRMIGEKLLVGADAWYQRYLGDGDWMVGGSAGAIYKLVEAFSVFGSAGVQSATGEVDPRLLIGISVQK